MTKRAASKIKQQKKGLPGWVWFLAGVALTLFCQWLIHLANVSSHPQQTKGSAPAIVWPKKSANEVSKPAIQFYETLKKQEVKVSDKVVADRNEGSYDYSLQAASFKRMVDADQLRAELILLGLDVSVKKTRGESGTTWYRVIVGPFPSRSLMAKARSTLLDNGYRPFKIKNFR